MNNSRTTAIASHQDAFVAVELLAVLAVIILLTGVVLPVATNLKHRSTSLRCINNHRQVVRAWLLYAEDNSDQCVNNFTSQDTIRSFTNGAFDNWANNFMTWNVGDTAIDRSVTNETWAAKGLLQPYAASDFLIYKCPADNFLSPAQRARGYQRRVRTTMMSGLIGRFSSQLEDSDKSWLDPDYRQWLKVRSIREPAATFVTLDGHPDAVNDGFFVNHPDSAIWGDIPASLHAGAIALSFADGHTEIHKWLSTRSRLPVIFRAPDLRTFDALGRKDFAWLKARTGLVRLKE